MAIKIMLSIILIINNSVTKLNISLSKNNIENPTKMILKILKVCISNFNKVLDFLIMIIIIKKYETRVAKAAPSIPKIGIRIKFKAIFTINAIDQIILNNFTFFVNRSE